MDYDEDATKYYDGNWQDAKALQAKFDGLGIINEENDEDESEDHAPWDNEDEAPWPHDEDDAAAWTGTGSGADQDEAAWTGTGSGAEQDEAAWGGTGDDKNASWMGAAGEDPGHSWIKDEDDHGAKTQAQNRQL